MPSCIICDRITEIKNHRNKYFIKELESGYVVLGDHQFYYGYTLFLSKIHARELHELGSQFKLKFLAEMAHVAEAVFKAFKPEKLNKEIRKAPETVPTDEKLAEMKSSLNIHH